MSLSVPQELNQSYFDWWVILTKSSQSYQQVDYKSMSKLRVFLSVPLSQDLWSWSIAQSKQLICLFPFKEYHTPLSLQLNPIVTIRYLV